MSYEEYQDVYRIIVVGDASVGKTSMIKSFVNGPNSSFNPKPTIGVDYSSKNIQLSNSHIIKTQIWDTAGQQNYRSVANEQVQIYFSFIRKANGALVVFDITNRKSFASVSYWINEIRQKSLEQNVPILLVGNKIDRAQYRAVSIDEANEAAKQFGITYREACSSDSSLLLTTFRQISQKILTNKSGAKIERPVGTALNPSTVPGQTEGTGRKNCC